MRKIKAIEVEEADIPKRNAAIDMGINPGEPIPDVKRAITSAEVVVYRGRVIKNRCNGHEDKCYYAGFPKEWLP